MPDAEPRSRRLTKVVVSLVIIILVIVGIVIFRSQNTEPDGPIPTAISEQLDFSPFVIPITSKDYLTSEYKYETAEKQVKVLSYKIKHGSDQVVVSEYPQPPEFSEIPEYKDSFLTNIINQYTTVQSANGAVYLGRAEKNNNHQLGIMLEKGLIVFLNPEKELQPSQWRRLVDQFEIQKASD